jgi:hypothetical protein
MSNKEYPIMKERREAPAIPPLEIGDSLLGIGDFSAPQSLPAQAMTSFSKKSGSQPNRPARLFPLFRAAAIFLGLLAMPGCESAASKKSKAPQPLPGRSANQAIQSRQNPALFAGKTSLAPDSAGAPAPAPAFAWPQGFNRVAALPIYSTAPTGGAIQDLDEIFRAELSKLIPLEVVTVSKADLLATIGEAQIASTAVIPLKLVQFLQKKYAVQGIVFTDMPVYRPYRPINIGVRSKLVQIPDMQVLWSASGILDSAEPGIAASALQYAERNLHGPGGGEAQLILQSPRRYAAFVANGLYGTLPSPPPAPGETKKPQH